MLTPKSTLLWLWWCLDQKYAQISCLRNQAPINFLIHVRFGIQGGPEPEPDLSEPELMVQVQVQGKSLNQTEGPVRGSAKKGK